MAFLKHRHIGYYRKEIQPNIKNGILKMNKILLILQIGLTKIELRLAKKISIQEKIINKYCA